MTNQTLILAVALASGCAGQSGCGNTSPDEHVPMLLNIGSPSFQDGADIPRRFTCDGANASPALSWQPPPRQTQSLALIVRDSDSLFGSFVHWVLYNLPPETTHLDEGMAKQPQSADGSRQGLSGNDTIGYTGPCPPGTSSHRYVFTLYALDSKLDLQPGVSEKQLRKAIEGHIIAAGRVLGRYHR